MRSCRLLFVIAPTLRPRSGFDKTFDVNFLSAAKSKFASVLRAVVNIEATW